MQNTFVNPADTKFKLFEIKIYEIYNHYNDPKKVVFNEQYEELCYSLKSLD